MALPPTMLTLYTTATLGGYTETLLFGNILLLMADGRWLLAESLAGRALAAIRHHRWICVLHLPADLDLPHPDRIAAALSAAVESVARLSDGAAGLCVGSAPWWLALIQSGGVLLAEMTGSAVAGTVESSGCWAGWLIRLLNFFLFGASAWWGLRYPWSAEFVLPRVGPCGAASSIWARSAMPSGAGRASCGA